MAEMKKLNILKHHNAKPMEILLLVTRSSGKTTIFNTVSEYFAESEYQTIHSLKESKKRQLRTQCVESALTLCEMARFYDDNYDKLKIHWSGNQSLEQYPIYGKMM